MEPTAMLGGSFQFRQTSVDRLPGSQFVGPNRVPDRSLAARQAGAVRRSA